MCLYWPLRRRRLFSTWSETPSSTPCKGMYQFPNLAYSRFVHVQVSYGPNEGVLTVKDSGVGIPCTFPFVTLARCDWWIATDIDLVGERFHRVASVSRSHEGTGIGLALIKVCGVWQNWGRLTYVGIDQITRWYPWHWECHCCRIEGWIPYVIFHWFWNVADSQMDRSSAAEYRISFLFLSSVTLLTK